MYALSKITAATSASKRFALDASGKLVSSPAIPIFAGEIERLDARDAKDIADIMASLWPTEVLLYGVSDHQHARITTKKKLTHDRPDIIPRSKSHIRYNAGPGVMCLDYDPQDGKAPLSHRELLQALYAAVPSLADAPMILTHSASSYIYNEKQQLRGSKGKRVYVLVKDATDIRRAGLALFHRLIAAEYGWTITTVSGAILQRTLIDRAMLSATQIDYAAGAICEAPLIQRRPEPIVIRNDAEPLDTREAIPDLPGRETVKTERVRKPARANAEPEKKPCIGDSPDAIMQPEESRLTRESLVELLDGRVLTIHEIMKNRKHFQAVECYDPVNPERWLERGIERRTAILYVRGGQPCIRSFADGGTRYMIPLAWIRPENTGPSRVMGPPRGLGLRSVS